MRTRAEASHTSVNACQSKLDEIGCFRLLVLGLLAVQTPEANAAACAAGVYHAGCVGHRGAVVTTRPAAYAHPVRVAPRCYYRAGVRVCR